MLAQARAESEKHDTQEDSMSKVSKPGRGSMSENQYGKPKSPFKKAKER